MVVQKCNIFQLKMTETQLVSFTYHCNLFILLISNFRFPKDNDQRQKWMSAVGLENVKKYMRVCSDHFEANLYHQTDGYTTLRRLLSDAVPCQITSRKVCPESAESILIDDNLLTNSCADSNDINVEENEKVESEKYTIQTDDAEKNIESLKR